MNPLTSNSQNKYIITTMEYTSKWVEARTLNDNTTKSTTKFLYEKFITQYGCPLESVID